MRPLANTTPKAQSMNFGAWSFAANCSLKFSGMFFVDSERMIV
jgi:hypothetical protein